MIIAIDGPAGSGKSTIAQKLSKRLEIEYIDSGALYRSLTLYGMDRFDKNIEGCEDEIARDFEQDPGLLSITYENHHQIMWLRAEDVSERIRDQDVTRQVRYVASNPRCRAVVNQKMKSIAEKYSCVIDGRDIGTVVFPDTPHKFYLDASAMVRAQRRAKDYGIEQGSPEFKVLLDEIEQRDSQDMKRTIAPLAKAKDAQVLDTSKMTVDAVLDWVIKRVQSSVEEGGSGSVS